MIRFLRKLRFWTQRRRREADLAAELAFHVDEEAAGRRDSGLSVADARVAARRDLGNLGLVQEETRAAWTWNFLEQLAQDARYTIRAIAANKTFSALAILSLALGIGANTAIFSFMDSILMRSLPVPHPESLVTFSWRTREAEVHGTNRHDDSFKEPTGGFVGGFFSWPALEMFRQNTTVFSAVFGYQSAGNLYLTSGNQTDVANVEYVTGDYFSGLGVLPFAGRLIAPSDDRTAAPSVAVVSYDLSQRRFGGPAAAMGRSIQINNFPFTVIGVAPPEFFGADPSVSPDLYVPMHANVLFEARARFSPARVYVNPDYDWVDIVARLQPGVSRAQALAAVGPQFSEFEHTRTTKRRRNDLAVLLLRDGAGGLDSLRRQYSKPLLILLCLVGLILAIACANIANLLLARAAVRRREIAIRLSIGAGRARVIRQLLTESVILASMGGALGIFFALWGIRSLTLLLAAGRDRFTLHAGLNWHVLAVVAALSLATGVLFGLAPALQATRVDLMPSLRDAGTGDMRIWSLRGLTLSRVLMVAQIGVAFVILAAAGLFARTLANLESIPLGFNREELLTFKLDARQAGHRDPEIFTFYNDLRARFAAIPGVHSAALSDMLLIGSGNSFTGISVEGGESYTSMILSVGPAFFATMQVPILLGREIEARDCPAAQLVAVVNEAFARKNFGSASPLGHHFSIPGECPKCNIEIVGVAGNAVVGNLTEEPMPTVYLPFTFSPWGQLKAVIFELRTTGNPLKYARAVRETLRQSDERVPISELRTQSDLIDSTINHQITFARLCMLFALLALTIACVGLYGAMSYAVARRRAEIGIRMALGAERTRVVGMILREVFLLVAAGLALAVPTALVASGVIESLLFNTSPTDPLLLTAAALTLAAAAILAGYLPARTAARIDPMAALRHE
jgi:predicted permease